MWGAVLQNMTESEAEKMTENYSYDIMLWTIRFYSKNYKIWRKTKKKNCRRFVVGGGGGGG